MPAPPISAPARRWSASSAGLARAASYSGEKWVAHPTRAKPHQASGGAVSAASGRLRSAGSSSLTRVSGVAACSASVTGRASTSSGAATRVSSRCCAMWTEKRSAAPASTGPSSATATAARPARNRAVRARETAPGPCSARARPAATSHSRAAATSRLAMQQVRLPAPAGRARPRRGAGVGDALQRQQQLEDAAGSRPAAHPDGAAVRLHDRLHDRQAEAGTALVAAAGLVEPGEALEDAGGLLGGHAAARVAHYDRHLVAPALGAQPDLVVRAGVLDRVLDQRVQRELEAVGVADHACPLAGVQPPAAC